MDLTGWLDLGRLRMLAMTGAPLLRVRESLTSLAPAPIVLFIVAPRPPTEQDQIACGALGEALRAAAADRDLATCTQPPSARLDEILRELGEIDDGESVAAGVAIGLPG